MYDKGKEPRLLTEMKGYHGSPKESHKIHKGEYAGTKELGVGSHPGKTARSIKPEEYKAIDKDSGKSGYKPKGMKRYTEE